MVLSSLRSGKFKRHKSSKSVQDAQSSQSGPSDQNGLSIPFPDNCGPHIAQIPGEDLDRIPQSELEARTHIEQIRAEKGLNGTDSNTADLQAALIVYVYKDYELYAHSKPLKAFPNNCTRNPRTSC